MRIDGTAAMLKAMGDPIRLRILAMLADGELCACKFHEAFGLPQNLVSHHLKVLQDNGLISGQKRGRNIFYSLETENLREASDIINLFRSAGEEK